MTTLLEQYEVFLTDAQYRSRFRPQTLRAYRTIYERLPPISLRPWTS
ncbi:MAG: hypothetical protein GFH25_541324n44 [Chloroflexi bacterium AL-N10]|nr:hypothetical protein [Chloroflexi bacterium AL-N10]